MKLIDHPKRLVMTMVLVSIGLLVSERDLSAGEESSILADFQKLCRAADPKRAVEAYQKEHPNPPSKEEAERLIETITLAAVGAMDRAVVLKQRYPESQHLSEVRSSLSEALCAVFAVRGLPIPPARAADLEVCTKDLLTHNSNDARLYIVLYRVAASLPDSQKLALYKELSREPTIEPARSMAQKALRDLERLGKPLALDFTALDGRKISLSQLKGKVVLIDFWSTTCLPCVREFPALKKLYATFQPEGLEIIGISLDSDKDVLERFIRTNELPWPQYYDAAGPKNPVAQTYGIEGIPVYWLIDRHGLLRHLDARQEQEQKIKALLKEQ